MAKFIRNRTSDYPEDWNQRRKKVYRRDDYQCQNCGSSGGPKGNSELHAHHIVPKSSGGTHDLSNLVCLCKECHNLVHDHPIGKASTNITEKDGKEKTSDSNPPGLDEVQDLILNLAGKTTEAAGHLSRYILTQEFKEIESFLQSYTEANLRLAYTSKKYSEFEEKGPISGLSGIQFKSHNQPQLQSNLKLLKLCVDLLDSLSKIYEKLKNTDTNAGGKISEDNQQEMQELFEDFQFDLSMITVAIARSTLVKENKTSQMKTENEIITSDWSCCPACGLSYSIFVDNENQSRVCILCESVWEKKGLIWKKWKCTQTPEEISMEETKCGSDEWDEIGQKANQEKIYEKFVNVQREEIMKLSAYISNYMIGQQEPS